MPHAKACLNAGLLDALEPGTKIGGVAGHRDEMVERKRSHPDPKKVTSAITGRSFKIGFYRGAPWVVICEFTSF